MARKKYQTEEERKAARRESNRRYRQKNKEKIAEYHAERYKANKEQILKRNTEYQKANKEKIAEYNAAYKTAHKDRYNDLQVEYRKTQIGRAGVLIANYKRRDRKHNRGECTIDAKWIVDNIFTKRCVYCGETDWHKLGCDRIDNDLPHTPENCVPCCVDCNSKKHTMPYEEFIKIHSLGKML